MANEHRGEVSFETPDGKSYVLKLSTNTIIAIEKEADKLQGLASTRFMLHAALTSVESQKSMTLEDAGELLDEIGDLERVNALIHQTKWGSMAKLANDQAEAKLKAALEAKQTPPTPVNGNGTEAPARPPVAALTGASAL